MIFIIGLIVAVFAEFLLISKKDKTRADKILIVWMIALTCHLFIFYIHYIQEIYNYPFLLGIGLLFPLLHALFLYFYVGTMTNQITKNRKIWALHFIPTVIVFVYLFSTFFILPSEEKIAFYQNERDTSFRFFIMVLVINIIGLLYILWSSWLLVKHKRNILEQFSNLEKINLKWLLFLTVGIGVVFLVALFGFSNYYLFATMAAFISLIAFFGLRQGIIFSTSVREVENHSKPVREVADNTESEDKVKYEKSSLTKQQSQMYLASLNELMDKDKLYLESKITLKEISDRLEISTNFLSQVINENLNQNFYDFINSHRIEGFKKRLKEDKSKKLTLLAHAYESGYNSKSTFNESFKKFTGQTPSQYQKELFS